MSDSLGVRLGVEGEREFKKALADINSSFKILGSEMRLVESQFDRQDNSVEALNARNEVLNRQIEQQAEKVAMLQQAMQNASESFGENDRRTQAWAVQLNNAQAELNNLQRTLRQNQDALENAANGMDEAAEEADDLAEEIEDAADETEKSGGKFQKFGQVMAGVGAAMGAALAAVGAAAVSAGKALAEMSVEAAAYADEMLTQSTVTGMSVESLQAYSYAADLVDVSLDTLTSSMAKNVKSMANAAEGSAKYADAYAQLGVSVTNADGSLRDSEEVYWEVIDALAEVANETERDAIAMQLFGKSAQDLNPLIAQGSEGIAALTQEAKDMGAVLSEETMSDLGSFDDSIQRLTQGSEAAKRVLGTVLLPELQTLVDDGVDLLGQFTSGLANAGGDFGKVSEVIGQTVGGIANMIMENLPKIISVGMDIVLALVDAIVKNIPSIVECASSMVTTLVAGLIEALPAITNGALQLILALVNALLEQLPAIIEAAIMMVVTLAEGIGEALPELIPAVNEAIVLICETLINHIDEIIEAAFCIVEGVITGILNALPKLVGALPQLINTIINFIVNNLPQIIGMGVELVMNLIVGLIQAIPELVANIPKIIEAIINGLGGAVTAVFDIGANIVKGLWDGICSLGPWLGDQICGFFGGIVDGAKDFLGIHSPSRVFAGIGENMGLGVGVGFEGAMAGVEKDMQDAFPTDFDVGLDGVAQDVSLEAKKTYEHTGTIRVEGVNNQGEITAVVDIIIDQLRQEARI